MVQCFFNNIFAIMFETSARNPLYQLKCVAAGGDKKWFQKCCGKQSKGRSRKKMIKSSESNSDAGLVAAQEI